MKRIIKELILCFLTFALTVAIIYKLGIIVRPINTDIAFNVIDTFHDMPKDTLEVIGYGSSHGWCSMNVMEMYEKYGIGAYNYGCNWQHINTTELFLKDSLLTQSPKVILIETFLVNDVLENVNINGEIYYTRGITDFEGKKEYLKQCFGNDIGRYLSYYVPLCAFHDNWVNLEKGSFQKRADGTNFYATMGYLGLTGVTPDTIPNPSTFEQRELSESAISVLDEIVHICKANNIEIIFYTAPYQAAYSYGDAIKAYARENDCGYVNLFEYLDFIGIDCETDFNDLGHLNNNGAMKVSDFLGEYIVNNYDVTDFRKVEGNIWEQNLR